MRISDGVWSRFLEPPIDQSGDYEPMYRIVSRIRQSQDVSGTYIDHKKELVGVTVSINRRRKISSREDLGEKSVLDTAPLRDVTRARFTVMFVVNCRGAISSRSIRVPSGFCFSPVRSFHLSSNETPSPRETSRQVQSLFEERCEI